MSMTFYDKAGTDLRQWTIHFRQSSPQRLSLRFSTTELRFRKHFRNIDRIGLVCRGASSAAKSRENR